MKDKKEDNSEIFYRYGCKPITKKDMKKIWKLNIFGGLISLFAIVAFAIIIPLLFFNGMIDKNLFIFLEPVLVIIATFGIYMSEITE